MTVRSPDQFKSDIQRHHAHTAVNHAVALGRLPRVNTQDCADCGAGAQAYHHDKGYEPEHRFDVVPLCDSCHAKRHVHEYHYPDFKTVNGQRVRELREALGVSIYRLSRHSDIPYPTLKRAEQGVPMRDATIRKLAKALGVEATELLGEPTAAPPVEAP